MDPNVSVSTATMIAAGPSISLAMYSVVQLYGSDPRGAFFWSAQRADRSDVEPRTGFASDFPPAVLAAHAAAVAMQDANSTPPIYTHNDLAADALHNLDALGPVKNLLVTGEKPPLWWIVKHSAGGEDPLAAAWRASTDPEAVLLYGRFARHETMDERGYATFLHDVLKTAVRFDYQLRIGRNGMRLDGGPQLPHDAAFADALREVLFVPPRLALFLQLAEVVRRVRPGACCACGVEHTAYDYEMAMDPDVSAELGRAIVRDDAGAVEAIVRDVTSRLHAPPSRPLPIDPHARNAAGALRALRP